MACTASTAPRSQVAEHEALRCSQCQAPAQVLAPSHLDPESTNPPTETLKNMAITHNWLIITQTITSGEHYSAV